MLLPGIHWPLASNMIRKNALSNTFGMVRDGGKRPHQGWDFLAFPGTRCFAIADGVIDFAGTEGLFGRTLVLKFQFRGQILYAAYCHLSMFLALTSERVIAGQAIALTGNTGNASSMTGDDQYLHFEIRNQPHLGRGLGGRRSPKEIFGSIPLNTTYCDTRLPDVRKMGMSTQGIKVSGVNVL